MKKLFFFFLGICILLVLFLWFIPSLLKKPDISKVPSDSFITPLPASSVKTSTVTWNDVTYAYEYFEVTDISKLTLIANFTQKKSGELVVRTNNCQYAINGGYYDTNNKPLGLFVNAILSSPNIVNPLVNGYISITNKATISFAIPVNPIFAIQTGPMIISDGEKMKLAIKNDEYARRMIAAISSKGTLIFMTIFVPETKIQGPKLADLPDIIERISEALPHPLISAINLDGGSASLFKNMNIYIAETSSVGSIFCVTE